MCANLNETHPESGKKYFPADNGTLRQINYYPTSYTIENYVFFRKKWFASENWHFLTICGTFRWKYHKTKEKHYKNIFLKKTYFLENFQILLIFCTLDNFFVRKTTFLDFLDMNMNFFVKKKKTFLQYFGSEKNFVCAVHTKFFSPSEIFFPYKIIFAREKSSKCELNSAKIGIFVDFR